MDLPRHAAVLWRFRAVTICGVVLGVALALLASYRPAWHSGPDLVPRGRETWTAQSSLLVTQEGFPEGRVVLPGARPASDQPTQSGAAPANGKVEFADPSRFMVLADLYARLLTTDLVLDRAPEKPDKARVDASPLPGNAATPILPIIQLTTRARTKAAAEALNQHMIEALRGVLAEQQTANAVPATQRVRIDAVDRPDHAVLTAGRSHTASVLALLLCFIGTIAATHLLANLRDRRRVPLGSPDVPRYASNGNGNGNGHGALHAAGGAPFRATMASEKINGAPRLEPSPAGEPAPDVAPAPLPPATLDGMRRALRRRLSR